MDVGNTEQRKLLDPHLNIFSDEAAQTNSGISTYLLVGHYSYFVTDVRDTGRK